MSNSLDVLPPRRQRKPLPLRISTDIPLFVKCSSDSSSTSSSPGNRNITPGTTSSTGIHQCFFHALSLHDFESSDPVHLPFHKDEVLTIIKQEHSGWWAAMRPRGDRIGWIPSSFVLPLNGSKVVEYPDERPELRPYPSLNDPPVSAVHDPWVSASEDCAALSFGLITPIDLVLYKGFFDDRVRHHDRVSTPQSDDQSIQEDACLPPTPEIPPSHKGTRSHPQNLFPSAPGPSQLLTSPSNATLQHHPYPTSYLCLTTPDNSDETIPELISSSDVLAVLKSVAISAHFGDGDGINVQSQCLGLPGDFRSAVPDQSSGRGSDHLAEQLCVLMHALYANIHQTDCLDWMAGRKTNDVSGLQDFLDVHDDVGTWVKRSIVAYDDITRQTETLDFWIRVAETCRSLRNFDSLWAIVSGLSGSSLSSLGAVWARSAHKETFETLREMPDVKNRSSCLTGVMDAATGPCVPFVRGYLDYIQGLRVGLSNSSHRPEPGRTADAGSSCTLRFAAVSTLLRHQSSPYDFGMTKSIRNFMDNKLRTYH